MNIKHYLRTLWRKFFGGTVVDVSGTPVPKEYTDRGTELEDAVLNILVSQPYWSSQLKTVEQLKANLVAMYRAIDWAQTLTPEQGKHYYLFWLEHGVEKTSETIVDVIRRSSKDHTDEITKIVERQRIKYERASALAKTLPHPPNT